jgi:hypothetical protein
MRIGRRGLVSVERHFVTRLRLAAMLAAVSLAGVSPARAQGGTCTQQQLVWLQNKEYCADQQSRLCVNGLGFTQDAISITFRAALENQFVSELVSLPVPLSAPGLNQLVVGSASYCGFVAADSAAEAIVLLTFGVASTPLQAPTAQDCTAMPTTLLTRYPKAAGVARLQLSWAAWKLKLHLASGLVQAAGGSTSALQPSDIAEFPSDSVQIQIPNATLTYRLAIFFSPSLTIMLVPDSDSNAWLPDGMSAVPANELMPKGVVLNTTIRLTASAIDHVAQSLGQTQYTYPSGNQTIGNLVISGFRWISAMGSPAATAHIATNAGNFVGSMIFGLNQGWLVLQSATLQAVQQSCSGNPVNQVACQLQNAARNAAAPIAAQAFLNRYGKTPIKPFNTTEVFPLAVAGKTFPFQGLILSNENVSQFSRFNDVLSVWYRRVAVTRKSLIVISFCLLVQGCANDPTDLIGRPSLDQNGDQCYCTYENGDLGTATQQTSKSGCTIPPIQGSCSYK